MYKPKVCAKALTDAVPVLARNPDMMRVFIDNGILPRRWRRRCRLRTGTRLMWW